MSFRLGIRQNQPIGLPKTDNIFSLSIHALEPLPYRKKLRIG